MQFGLVVLDGQYVVSFRFDNFPGNFFLAPHGINRNSGSLELKQLEQARNGCDLVGLLFGFDLAQDNAILSRPSTDHVNERLAVCVAKRPTQSLAINRDDLTLSHLSNVSDPVSKCFLQSVGIESCEDATNGVMGGDPFGKVEKSIQKFFLGSAPEITASKARARILVNG